MSRPLSAAAALCRVAHLVLVAALPVAVVVTGVAPGGDGPIVRPVDAPANRVAIIGDSYTTGTAEGGRGAASWPAVAWRMLAVQGIPATADVHAEMGAGYNTRGEQGSAFGDLVPAVVRPDDALVVVFGSRNDQAQNPGLLSVSVYGTLTAIRRAAPRAHLLVIGPPWPTAQPPANLLRVRDELAYQAGLAGAHFVDPIAAGWLVGHPELIAPDAIHPNDAGHAYLAAAIVPLIVGELGSSFPARQAGSGSRWNSPVEAK